MGILFEKRLGFKYTEETKNDSSEEEEENFFIPETQEINTEITDLPEFSQTQDDLVSTSFVENTVQTDDEEESDSVIFDLSEEPLFRGDAYFGSVRTAIAVKNEFNVHFIGVVKQYDANYPKQAILDILRGKPAGTKIVLTATVKGIKLVAIGYNQNKSDTVCLLMTEGAGSTIDDECRPRGQKFIDKFRNVCVRKFARPKVVNEYYYYCGIIDDHNRRRQGYLRLEQKWVSHSGFGRIFTTIVGLNIVDTYLLCKYQKVSEKKYSRNIQYMSVLDFVEMFAYQSLQKIPRHTHVVNTVVNKKRSFELTVLQGIEPSNEELHEDVRKDDEVPGTQLNENPSYERPSRLRELLLFDGKENDGCSTPNRTRTSPESPLYEITNSTLCTPSSATRRNINESIHVCTQTAISDSKSTGGKYPRKRRKQLTCVYCRTKGKYKWTSYYCQQCNVALCKGDCFSNYHNNL